MAFVCFADQIFCRRKSILSHHEIECCCEFGINHTFCHKYRQKVCVEWWNLADCLHSENIHASLLLIIQLPSFKHLIRFHMVMYCYRYREAKSFSFWFFGSRSISVYDLKMTERLSNEKFFFQKLCQRYRMVQDLLRCIKSGEPI